MENTYVIALCVVLLISIFFNYVGYWWYKKYEALESELSKRQPTNELSCVDLKQMRHDLNLSLRKVEKDLKISRTTINNVEKGTYLNTSYNNYVKLRLYTYYLERNKIWRDKDAKSVVIGHGQTQQPTTTKAS